MNTESLATFLSETSQEGIEKEGMVLMKASLEKLYDLWKKLDLDQIQTAQRTKMVWTHVHNLLRDILDEENTFYEDIKCRVQDYSTKIFALSKILSVSPKELNCSLIQKEKILRHDLDILNNLKDKRKQAYQNLKNTVLRYCQILNINDEVHSDDADVPSENDLQSLERRVTVLKEEKEKRSKKFLKLKKELTTILEITELPPETLLEENILSGKENFSLSQETFEVLEEGIATAQRKKLALETRKEELMEKLATLWTMLKVEENKKVKFLSNHLDIRPSTLKSIEEELDKCEKIKRQNAQIYVDSLRQELEELWSKCYVSKCQQQQFFRPIFATEITEVVVKDHESEVKKWRNYHKEVSHILEKIAERQQLFDLMVVFENKSTDPKRFKNRKGNLLQEERERKNYRKSFRLWRKTYLSTSKRTRPRRTCPSCTSVGTIGFLYRINGQNEGTKKKVRSWRDISSIY